MSRFCNEYVNEKILFTPTFALLFLYGDVYFRGKLHYVGHVGYQKNEL